MEGTLRIQPLLALCFIFGLSEAHAFSAHDFYELCKSDREMCDAFAGGYWFGAEQGTFEAIVRTVPPKSQMVDKDRINLVVTKSEEALGFCQPIDTQFSFREMSEAVIKYMDTRLDIWHEQVGSIAIFAFRETVRNFVLRREIYAIGKRSSNMIANWLLTACQLRTERFHSVLVALSAR